MSRTLIAVMLAGLTKSSAQELFVFPDLALFTERDWRALGCDSIAAMRSFEPLSPGVPRNGMFSFLIAIPHKPGEPFTIEIGQNPPNAFHLRLYRIFPGVHPELELIETTLSLRARVAEGQRCALFVLDASVDPGMATGRVKLEPAVWTAGGLWLRHPMEVRVLPLGLEGPPAPACDEGGASDPVRLARAASRPCTPAEGLCVATVAPRTVPELLARNLTQDLELLAKPKVCKEAELSGPVEIRSLLTNRSRADNRR